MIENSKPLEEAILNSKNIIDRMVLKMHHIKRIAKNSSNLANKSQSVTTQGNQLATPPPQLGGIDERRKKGKRKEGKS